MRKDKRTYFPMILFILLCSLLLAACGGKSQENVNKKLEKKLAQVDGYKAEAEMIMKTGKEARTYQINVWFKKGEQDFYRVDLMNETEDHQQTILKNDEGVFVLTPVLNKSFKFQSDWPENNGQPYLYQSLIQDIIADKEATFINDDAYYLYKTKTNYMNNNHLPFQEVYIDKKTYLPLLVKVLGEDEEPLIEVKFHNIKLDPNFAKDDFNRESILGKNDVTESLAMESERQHEPELLLPTVTKGAELIESEEIPIENGKRIISTFTGDRNFTFIQEQTETLPASGFATEMHGELVHLGHSIGAVTNDMVEWNVNGVNYYLVSNDMTMDELIEVATSVYGRSLK